MQALGIIVIIAVIALAIYFLFRKDEEPPPPPPPPPPDERIGSFTLYITSARQEALTWRVIYKDRSHSDGRYLRTWHSISSNFLIVNVDLDHCELQVTQRKNGYFSAVWYGPFSDLIHGNAYTLNLETGELVEGGIPEPPPPPPPPTTKLSGYVTDIITGMPIVGVAGIVYQDYGTKTKKYDFTTNSVGYYEIRDMLHEYDVTQMVIYASGYETYTKEDITITEGENKLDIRMKPEFSEEPV